MAERFEVSQRTVNRDIEALCLAGIPIVTRQGKGGGISILPGYKLDRTVFTPDELAAVVTGLRSLDSVSSTQGYRAIADKLALVKEDVFSADENVFIELSDYNKRVLSQKIDIIKKAIGSKRIIVFTYYSKTGESRRTAEPYYIIFRWSAWYLLGYCLEKEDFRLFKLGRLWELEMIGQQFEPREIPQRQTEYDRYFDGQIKLVALFNQDVKYRIVDEYGVDNIYAQPDGRLRFELGFTDMEYLLGWLLGYGDAVEVLEPPEIRAELVQRAKKIIEKHK